MFHQIEDSVQIYAFIHFRNDQTIFQQCDR